MTPEGHKSGSNSFRIEERSSVINPILFGVYKCPSKDHDRTVFIIGYSDETNMHSDQPRCITHIRLLERLGHLSEQELDKFKESLLQP